MNRETPFKKEREKNNNQQIVGKRKQGGSQAFTPYTELTKDESGKWVKIQVTAPGRRLNPRLLDLASEIDKIVTTNEPSSVCERHSRAPGDGNLEDLVTVGSSNKNPRKCTRSQISYDETPKRPDIKSRLGPKSSIKNRLGFPTRNIKSRMAKEKPQGTNSKEPPPGNHG